ncbi:MAG: DUF6541 family protein [Candidatus Woesearchaeota archaeon]
MDKKVEYGILALIWATTFYLYLLPVSDLPFGDVDASTHFSIADTMFTNDQSIYWLPYQINATYGFASGGKIWYPPHYHLDASLIQLFSNERIIGFFFFTAFTSSLIVLSMFLFARHLYGFLTATVATLLAAFSARDILVYFFSQWPQAISFFYVPAFLYVLYRALHEYENRKKYSIIAALILASQFFFHPQGFITSGLIGIIYIAIISFKEKKLPFSLKESVIPISLLIILILLFIQFPLSAGEKKQEAASFARLFSWYADYSKYSGEYPQSYFSYSYSHGIWTLPFLVLGLIYILYRRKNQDIMMLSILIGYYIITHLDVIGYPGRVPRFYQLESLVFYPLIAIGAILTIPSFFKQYKEKTKVASFFIILILILFFNAPQAYSSLKNAQPLPYRITHEQLELAEWLNNNVPEKGEIGYIGTTSLSKIKWLRQLSQRFVKRQETSDTIPNFIIIDGSDLGYLNAQNELQQLKQIEQSFNLTPIYNKNNIKVYKIG